MARAGVAGWLLCLPALLVTALLLVAPLIAIIALSLDGKTALAGYEAFFKSAFNQAVLWRTLRIALLVTAIAAVIGLPTAYVIARSPASRRGLLIVGAVFPLLTSSVVRSFAWIVILGREGLVNDLLQGLGLTAAPVALLYNEISIVIGLVYLFAPLMILSLVGVMENIDTEVTAAASSLGAPPRRVFVEIVLPLAVPGLIIGCVLVFTGSFTSYTTPQLLGGDGSTVLATLLQRKAMVDFDWPLAASIAVLMVLVTVSVIVVMNGLARRISPVRG